jgi:hypothetical protein
MSDRAAAAIQGLAGSRHEGGLVQLRQDHLRPADNAVTCVYELRNLGVVVSTGRIRLEQCPDVADTLPLNGTLVSVHDVEWCDGQPYLTLGQSARIVTTNVAATSESSRPTEAPRALE